MKFIKFSIFVIFFTIAYLAHVLSRIDANHVHEIALTFVAIGSILAGGVSLLGLSEDKDKKDVVIEDDGNI